MHSSKYFGEWIELWYWIIIVKYMTMKKYASLPLCWGVIHGLNDYISGFILSHYSISESTETGYLLMILYAVLAFGGQLPLGLWLDSNRGIKRFGLTAVFLMLLAVMMAFINPFAAVLCVGVASAGIHVAGGSVCVLMCNNKTGPLAVFTAPGVLGLTLGILSGQLHMAWLGLPAMAGMFCLASISRLPFPLYIKQGKKEAVNQFDNHDVLMIGILLIMSFRSFIYDIINHFAGNLAQGILIIGLSAFVGKIIGGFMADKIGWKRWVYISLPLAFFFLQFGKDNLYMLAFGIACLQSSVPITHLLMYKAIPSFPATATALSLGTAIALAGLPLYAFDTKRFIQTWFADYWLWFLFAVSSVLLWLWVVQYKKSKQMSA